MEGGRLQVAALLPAPSGLSHGRLFQAPSSDPQQQPQAVANFNSNLHGLLQQQQLFPATEASLPLFVPPPRPSNVLLEQLLASSEATRNNHRRLIVLQDAMVLDAASTIQLRRQRQAAIIRSSLQQQQHQQRPLAAPASTKHAAAAPPPAPLPPPPSTTIITHDEARRNCSSRRINLLQGDGTTTLDGSTRVTRRNAEEDSSSSLLPLGGDAGLGGSLTPTKPSAPAGSPESSSLFVGRATTNIMDAARKLPPASSPSSTTTTTTTTTAVATLSLPTSQRLHQPLDPFSISSSPSPATTKPALPPSQNAAALPESDGELQAPLPSSSPPSPPIIKPLSQYNYFFQDVRDFVINKMTQAEGIGLTKCIMATGAPDATNKHMVGIERHLSPHNFLILHGPKHKDRLLQNHLQRDRTTRRKHCKGHGKLDFYTMNKAISELWKIMPDHGKQFYMDVCQADKQRFDAEMHKRRLSKEKSESSSASSPSPT